MLDGIVIVIVIVIVNFDLICNFHKPPCNIKHINTVLQLCGIAAVYLDTKSFLCVEVKF